jgi:hypothetical protein
MIISGSSGSFFGLCGAALIATAPPQRKTSESDLNVRRCGVPIANHPCWRSRNSDRMTGLEEQPRQPGPIAPNQTKSNHFAMRHDEKGICNGHRPPGLCSKSVSPLAAPVALNPTESNHFANLTRSVNQAQGVDVQHYTYLNRSPMREFYAVPSLHGSASPQPFSVQPSR